MNTGQTYIDIPYNHAWIDQSLASISGFSWLFEWGMYLFLLVAIAICIWIFFDSVNKKKGQKSLVPRILSIVGIFLILPAFIFKFTGNADGVTNLVRLSAENGTPYYNGAIYWNVKWLVAGYGVPIAVIALLGVVCSVVAVVIYMSTVSRAKPSTEFVKQVSDLQSSVNSLKTAQAAANASTNANAAHSSVATAVKAASSASTSPKTVIDVKPQAATVIDVPMTSASLTYTAGAQTGQVVRLPQRESVIGRGANSTITVDDAKASGTHARLSMNGNQWVLADLGSTNGTFVNGARLNGPQVLVDGDVIKIGDSTMKFMSR